MRKHKLTSENSIFKLYHGHKKIFSKTASEIFFFGLSTIQKNKMNFQDYPLGKISLIYISS